MPDVSAGSAGSVVSETSPGPATASNIASSRRSSSSSLSSASRSGTSEPAAASAADRSAARRDDSASSDATTSASVTAASDPATVRRRSATTFATPRWRSSSRSARPSRSVPSQACNSVSADSVVATRSSRRASSLRWVTSWPVSSACERSALSSRRPSELSSRPARCNRSARSSATSPSCRRAASA